MMTWKVVNDEYLNYLRGFDSRIPRTDYGESKYKPFFGVLFEIGEICYVTQVSSPKERHKKMKNSLDFYKLYNPKDNSLLSVINLNYMFPIPKSELYDLEYGNLKDYRTFNDNIEYSKYINLLKVELSEINKLKLSESAKKLYDIKKNYPEGKLSQRCLDFAKLESKAYSWMKKDL